MFEKCKINAINEVSKNFIFDLILFFDGNKSVVQSLSGSPQKIVELRNHIEKFYAHLAKLGSTQVRNLHEI